MGDIKQTQVELAKDKIYKVWHEKYTNGVKSKLDTTEDKISEFKDPIIPSFHPVLLQQPSVSFS